MKKVKFNELQVGDKFNFGRYSQKVRGGVLPITWRVLDKDSDSLLVISELCLDAVSFNNINKDTDWENCSLRGWLNDYFLNTAFQEHEKAVIKKSALLDTNTEDYVFCLSKQEVENLFSTEVGEVNLCTVGSADRAAYASAYALKKREKDFTGAHYVDLLGSSEAWWLRSEANFKSFATFVHPFCNISQTEVNHKGIFVRPALRIAL